MREHVVRVLGLLFILWSAPGWTQTVPPRVMALSEVLDATEEQELRWPVAIAADEDRVGVADAFRPRLLVFERVGVSWTLSREVPLAATPVGLVRLNDVWVLSLRGVGQLQTIDDGGRTGAVVPLQDGVVPGTLAAVQGGSLLAYDAAASRVIRLGRDGAVTGSVEVDGYVTALADEGDGAFIAAIGDRGRLLRFDDAGVLTATWNLPGADPLPAWPTGIAIEPGGRIFVTDKGGGRILVLDREGRWVGLGSRQGWDPAHLLRPAGIARVSSGEAAVADLGNGRVQLFRLTSNIGGS